MYSVITLVYAESISALIQSGFSHVFVVYSEPIEIVSIFLSTSLSNQSYESFNRRDQ